MTLFVMAQLVLVAGLVVGLLWSWRTAHREPVMYVVSLSSGVSSAVAADRTIAAYGAGNVALVFMDTLWEDDDNYRFMSECAARWHMPVVRIVEGRNPLQVAEDEHIIPNQKIAPCTRRLKIIPFLGYVERWQVAGYQVVVMLGMDWKEKHRQDAPTRNYGERGIVTEYPLMWKPYETDMFATVRAWGIEPPRMYRMGYSHANCGGRCVKQGKSDWKRTLTYFPDRYDTVETWEATQRTDSRFAEYAFLRHGENGFTRAMSLHEFRQSQNTGQLALFSDEALRLAHAAQIVMAEHEDDTTFCFCNAGDPGAIGAPQ